MTAGRNGPSIRPDAFAAAGYGQGDIPVSDRPVLLLVDFQKGFTGGEAPLARSAHVQSAVERAAHLAAHARRSGVKVFHTFVSWRSDGADLGWWSAKIPALAQFYPGSNLESIDDRVLDPRDIVIHKRKPSAFFGTGLDAILRELAVDTVIVGGVTTSGCVRATITDAFSYGFRCVVAADACGDQDPLAHGANLADVARRYANVWSVDQVTDRLLLAALQEGVP